MPFPRRYDLFPNSNVNDCAVLLTIYLLNAKQKHNQFLEQASNIKGKFGGSGGRLEDIIKNALSFLETNYNKAYKQGKDIFSKELKEPSKPPPVGKGKSY